MPNAYEVVRLSTTPVKGLMLHHPDTIELTDRGAVGDRRFYLLDDDGGLQSCTRNQALFGLRAAYDEGSGRLTVARGDEVLRSEVVELSDTVDTDMWGTRTITGDVVQDPAWSTFFSDLVGRQVRLVRARPSAYDVWPATLLGTASVRELARHAGVDEVDPRRFRMLIEFSGGEPHVEDAWDGRSLRVGDALLRAGGPVKRCAATTRHPDTGAVDLKTLRLITDYRGRQPSQLGVGANFGVYADVLEPGTVAVGDRLTLDT